MSSARLFRLGRLKDPTPDELEEMREEFGLHELAVEDARHGHQRPKIEEYGNSLFAVLQTVEIKEAELHVGEVDIFVGPNYILSVRLHTERGFADVRARCEREPHLLKHGAAYVFYALMDAVVDRYFPILDALESELEQIEEQIFMRNTARSNIEALYALKRSLMTLNSSTPSTRSWKRSANATAEGARRFAPAWANISAMCSITCNDCTRRSKGYATCRPPQFRSTSA